MHCTVELSPVQADRCLCTNCSTSASKRERRQHTKNAHKWGCTDGSSIRTVTSSFVLECRVRVIDVSI